MLAGAASVGAPITVGTGTRDEMYRQDRCDEHGDPTYIVELIKKITTVSMRTVELVAQLAK